MPIFRDYLLMLTKGHSVPVYSLLETSVGPFWATKTLGLPPRGWGRGGAMVSKVRVYGGPWFDHI